MPNIKKKRIVLLDLEGTLIEVPRVLDTIIPKSMWQTLAQILGSECLKFEENSHQQWLRGEIPNYLAWMKLTVEGYIRFGLDARAIQTLREMVKPTAGIKEFCEAMRDEGAVIAIVTGALKSVAEPVQILTKADHLFAGCELYFDKVGNVLHWNLLPSDWYGKVDFLNLLIREYGAESADCVFVGDGANDVELAKQVGFSIAFNADPQLQAVASRKIDTSDFRDLIPLVLEFWNSSDPLEH